MSAMEQSLRRALDAGDANDPAFRETIYAASERALERMIAERPLDEEAAQVQRVRLAETINRVEQDYYQAADAAVDEEPGAWAAADAADASGPAAGELDESVATSERGDLSAPAPEDERVDDQAPSFLRRSADPVADRPKVPDAAGPPRSFSTPGFGGGGRAPAGRFRQIFAVIVILAFAVLAYLVYGMIYGPTATAPAGPTTSDAGPSGHDGGWIALFDGTQLASIATPTGGRVETVTGEGERPGVRLSSASEGGEIEVAVGPGVARQLAGETVRVEVTVGSPDGSPREFGVRCLFSGETVCGHQRFTTALAAEAFVFEMAVPRGARKAGSIAIEPGYEAGGLPLDLYGVRARRSDAA